MREEHGDWHEDYEDWDEHDDYYGGKMNGDYHGADGYGGWEPIYFEEAQCCMPGMDCWNAAYEGASGKENMEMELESLREGEAWAREHFDALNLDVLIKEQAARQLEFAESQR